MQKIPTFRLNTQSDTQRFLKISQKFTAPVLVKGFVDRWPAFEKWDFSYLRRKAGKRSLRVHRLFERAHAFDRNSRQNTFAAEMRFTEFLRRIQRGDNEWTVREQPILRPLELKTPTISDLAKDIFPPPFVNTRTVRRTNLWISNGGHLVTELHYDFHDSFICLVRGRKQIKLFPPWHADKLYPRRILSRNCFASRLKGLEFVDVEAIEVELREAEALFIPSFWWHHVQNSPYYLSVTIELNHSLDLIGKLVQSRFPGYYAATTAKSTIAEGVGFRFGNIFQRNGI